MSRSTRRGRTLVEGVAGLAVFVAVLGGGAAGVAGWLKHADAGPAVTRCAAALDGTSWYLAPDQADTAALVAATSLRRGLPARATTIALATGLQESKLRNLAGGDRDSVGVFQQRPSQGWGTAEQIMDPVYATNAFYDALLEVDDYQSLPITQAAQAVQRSAYPDAYADHEAQARAWASAMYGYTGAAVTCTLPDPEGPGDPQAVALRVQRDLGDLPVSVGTDGVVDVDASALSGGGDDLDRMGWAVAHWAVSVAEPLAVVQVQHGATAWGRADGTWEPVEGDPLPPGTVRITLAG